MITTVGHPAKLLGLQKITVRRSYRAEVTFEHEKTMWIGGAVGVAIFLFLFMLLTLFSPPDYEARDINTSGFQAPVPTASVIHTKGTGTSLPDPPECDNQIMDCEEQP